LRREALGAEPNRPWRVGACDWWCLPGSESSDAPQFLLERVHTPLQRGDVGPVSGGRFFQALGLRAHFFASDARDLALQDRCNVGHSRIVPAPTRRGHAEARSANAGRSLSLSLDIACRFGYRNHIDTMKTAPHVQLAALADPTREAIVRLLAERDWSVGEIAEQLPVSRPAVSKHLRLLQSAGLVRFQSFGTRNVYSLQADALQALRDQIDAMWRQSLARFSLVANNRATKAGKASR
jgi:DNA-binding transcriptional ArsR family regulator